MKKILLTSILILVFFVCPIKVQAQDLVSTTSLQNAVELPDSYFQARVTKILEEGQQDVDGVKQDYQKLEVEILNGENRGKIVPIDHGVSFAITQFQKVTVGEEVVLAHPAETFGAKKNFYYIVDKYRVGRLEMAALIFFTLAIYFGRKRGFTSIVGMLFTILVIFYYIMPHILKGGDPLLTCIVGAVIIILLSLYLSHGFNRRTTVALISTLISLGFAILIDYFFVHLTKLAGNGTEEAFYLQLDNLSLNLQGLLMGSIIIGVLGVLDDVTTGQSASIEEIHLANPKLTFSELYKSGLSVGREHIASLVNTLVLAYAGASFPLLLLYSVQKLQPFWVTMNSNFIAEEIVRTLVGSAVLVMAVPLTTVLAAWYYSKQK